MGAALSPLLLGPRAVRVALPGTHGHNLVNVIINKYKYKYVCIYIYIIRYVYIYIYI